MKTIRILLLCLFAFNFVNAQVNLNSKRIGDVYFENKEYFAAATYYKKTLQTEIDTSGFLIPYGFEQKNRSGKLKKDDYEYAVYQLATSLKLYHNYQDAEQWYALASKFDHPNYSKSNFYYGQCLRANLKYSEAIRVFKEFIAGYKNDDDYVERAKVEIKSCEYALSELAFPRLVKVEKLRNNVNKEGSNYAPILFNNELFFTSSRPEEIEAKDQVLKSSIGGVKVMKKETPFINAIYVVEDTKAQATGIEVKKVDMNLSKMQAAATSFHPNGNMMFVTTWRTDKNTSKKQIAVSKKINGGWSEPAPLGAEVNIQGFNSIQPGVTVDGNYLIFSSDRPGGEGGYDLWYASIRTDGSIGNAENMGRVINTKHDEQAGYFIAGTSKLIFSSNGRVGFGGYDFYESEGDFAEWKEPVNLGYPFNSAKDDIYFTALDLDGRTGYISSDRESVCCLEVFKFSREFFHINGDVVDCKTKKGVPEVTVTIKGADIPETIVKTDQNGEYSLKVESNRGLEINYSKDNYFSKNVSYNYKQLVKADTLFHPSVCLDAMVINKPIVLNNILYEFNKADLTDSSKTILDTLHRLMIDNPTIEIELGAHTDNIGSAKYNMELSDKRAKSCVDYLVSKGVDIMRMTWKGYGFTKAIAPNQLPNGKDNPEGRAMNRRTEFKVTKRN